MPPVLEMVFLFTILPLRTGNKSQGFLMTSESNKQKNLRLNTLLDHVHTFMKAIIVFILSCLSVFAADTKILKSSLGHTKSCRRIHWPRLRYLHEMAKPIGSSILHEGWSRIVSLAELLSRRSRSGSLYVSDRKRHKNHVRFSARRTLLFWFRFRFFQQTIVRPDPCHESCGCRDWLPPAPTAFFIRQTSH